MSAPAEPQGGCVMAKKPQPKPSGGGKNGGKKGGLPWLPPGTASTWICPKGHINPRTSTKCRSCK